jgi:hypothetical protein
MTTGSSKSREGQSDAVKNCAESVKAEHPDLTKSQAFAICQSMENEGELSAGDVYAGIHELDIDDEVDDAVLEDLKQRRNHAAGDAGVRLLKSDFDAPGPVERVEQEGDAVSYGNLLVIGPGEWTDSAQEETIYYSPEAIHGLADDAEERVVDTSVNVNHEHTDQLKQVGSFDPDSLETDEQGNLYGDVTLHGRTQASEDAIGLMDLALESDGEQGAGGLSVEIPLEGERTEWDRDRGMEKMVAFNLGGLSIVTESASEPAAFDQQFQKRAVAMAAADDASVRVMHRASGQTDLNGQRPGETMELEEALTTLAQEDAVTINVEGDNLDDEDEGEDVREQQDGDEMELVQDIIERAESEGFETGERTAAELIDFVGNNMDLSEEELQAIEDVADAYLQAEEAESLDATPAERLLDFVREQGGEPDDEEGDEEGDEEEAGEGEEAEMQDELSEIQDELRELREEKTDLEERLETIEDEPQKPRSLRENASPDEDEDEGVRTPAAGRVQRNGDFISR